MQAIVSNLVMRSAVTSADADAVRAIVASTGFFTEAEVGVAVELIEDRIAKGAGSEYQFIFAECDGGTIGYACYGEIACTVGSYDLYWIAVHNEHRGAGVGRQLLIEAEQRIAARGGRRIYVETSSRPQYKPTRQFYLKNGYAIEAALDDFYAPGDGKVILMKALPAAAAPRVD